jgi:hypothetical protein
MDRRQLLTGAVASAAAAATPARAHAAQGRAQGIVGSWFGTVTATNPPLGRFNDLISFHLGGVVTESRRYLVTPTLLGNLLETSGHGAWSRTGGHTFDVFFRFLLQNADGGEPIGTDNVRISLALDDATGTLMGRFVSQVKDIADAVLVEVTGDYSATRISV